MRSKPSQHVFLIIDLAKWAPRITKYELCQMLPASAGATAAKALVCFFVLFYLLNSPLGGREN
jgi:hypothetical protein